MALSFALPAALREFGFRETLLGFAGFGFTIAIATLAWKPLVTGGRGGVRGKGGRREGKEGEEGCAEKKRKRWLGYVVSKVYAPELWSNKAFIVWCLAIAVARFGYMEPNFHLVNHVRSLFPSHNAPILVTIMAGTSGFSKLFFGLVSDFLRHHRISLQQGALLVYGVTQLLVPVCGQWTGFLLMAVCLGLSDALIMVLFGPNVVDLVGPARASQAFGFMSLLSIPGFLSAPAITGRLHDELNHYDAGFYLAGAVSVLAAVIMFCVTRPCLACCYVTADVTSTKEGNRGSTKTVPRGQTETAEQTSALCTSLQPFQHRPDSTPIPRVTAALTSNQRYGDLNLDDHHNRRMETPEGRSLRPELSSKCCTPRDSNAAHIRTLSGGLKDQDTCTRQTRATSRTSNNAHDLKPEDAGARNIIERDCLSMCDPSHHNDIQSQALDTDLPSTDMQLTNSDKQVKAHVTAQNERVLDLAKLPTRSQESDDESGFTESTHL